MSGLEIVGVVLGGFSVATTLVKGIQLMYKNTKAWRNFQGSYSKIWSDLCSESRIFEYSLSLLLLDLKLSQDEVDAMMKDTRDSRWRDPSVAAQLNARLNTANDAYLDSMRALSDTMLELEKALGVNDHVREVILEHHRRGDSSSVLERLKESKTLFLQFGWKRFSMIFSQDTVKGLISDIGRRNQYLKDLGDQSARLDAKRRRSTRGRVDVLRQHVEALHRFLTRQWPCTCATRHRQARIVLKNRFEINKVENLERQSAFDVVFSEVVPFTDTLPERRGAFVCKVHQKAKVQFSQPSANAHSRVKIRQQSFGLTTFEDTAPETKSFCAVLPRPEVHVEASRRFIESQHSITVEHYSQPADQAVIWDNLIPIASLLSSSSDLSATSATAPNSFEFSLQHRLHLAASISSTFFAILNTEWYPTNWGLKVLKLHHSTGKLSRDSLLDYQFPPKGKSHQKDRSLKAAFISLAICLEELCFGQEIRAQPFYSDTCDSRGEARPYTLEIAARIWAEHVEDWFDEQYASAVRSCLDYATKFEKSLESDSKLWQKAHDDVVEPLEQTLQFAQPEAMDNGKLDVHTEMTM